MRMFVQFKQNSRKIEFGQFCTRSVGIVESYKPDDLKISTAFNEAKAALLQVDGLKILSYKLPLTKEQKALSVKLDKAISVLLRYTVVKRKKSEAANEEANSLHELIESYLRGYSQKNLYQKTGIVKKMLTVIQADTVMVQTADSEELTPVIEKISEVYNELDALYKRRNKVIANREKMRTDKIKRSLYFILRELFTSIEMAKLANPDLQYDALINELNLEITRFNAGSKPRSRKTGEVEVPVDTTEKTDTEKAL